MKVRGAPNRTFALALISFALLSALAGAGLLHGVDLGMLRAAQTNLPGFMYPLGKVLSSLADAGPATLALAALCGALFLTGRQKLSLRLAAAYVILSLVEIGVKLLLPVPVIPDTLRLDATPLTGPEILHPYPSGHMLRSVVVLGALFVLLPNVLVRTAILAFLVLMAITRVYLGVHWPSDLVGGALLGVAGLAWAFDPKRKGAKQ